MLSYFTMFSTAEICASAILHAIFITVPDLVVIVLWKNVVNNIEVNYKLRK